MEEQDINEFITIQEKPIRYYLAFSGLVIVIGIVIFYFGQGKDDNLIKIGGGFISTLSGFPLKEILSRKEKIQTVRKLDQIRARLVTKLSDSPSPEVANDVARIKDELWKFLVKPLNS